MKARRPPRALVDLSNNRELAAKPLTAAASHFAECPRCGAMADGLTADSGDVFAADCFKCGLPGSTCQITLWDLEKKRQLEISTPLHLQRAVDIAAIGDIAVDIWQGDIKVASYKPGDGAYFYAGRCETEE